MMGSNTKSWAHARWVLRSLPEDEWVGSTDSRREGVTRRERRVADGEGRGAGCGELVDFGGLVVRR
eukprot:3452596-Rhodomonas_salina.1